jgi:hypothetical protein
MVPKAMEQQETRENREMSSTVLPHSSLTTFIAMPILKVTQLRVQCQDERGAVFYIVTITRFTWKYRRKLHPFCERVILASEMPQLGLYIQDC